jgi:2-C-methyl-D-erythritol 4-phosphate cytidylyltransferase
VSAPDVGVVIVAAGASSRTAGGELKQFRWLAGRPMLLHSLQLFQQRADVAMVVCVLPREYAGDPPPWIFQSDSERLLLSVGGRTRAESVRNGMADLPASCGIVLVHDAARPLVPMPVVDRVVDAVRAGTSAIAALPVVDTLKEADENGRIVRTVPREGDLCQAQPADDPRHDRDVRQV